MDRPAGDTRAATQRPSLLDLALGGGVPKRSFFVALVVGTLLNLINQGDALVAGAPLDWFKIGLTYMVPYCVATYGAVTARLAALEAKE
ncbi:MAG: nitrate/nitrite transporter NrtS [Alphaproteobacteria bacterium]|nr:nitrate/nitrite transporter NrtS [Alphaproteobacteria bacterium]